MSARRCSSRARSPGATARQAGKAALARATAASTSAAVARCTSARTSSVAGSMTWRATALSGLRRELAALVRLAELRVQFADGVARAGERLARADQPPDPDRQDHAAGHQRGVVDELPVELVVPWHAARVGRQDEDDRDQPHPEGGERVHPLVLAPEGPRAGLERIAHPPA